MSTNRGGGEVERKDVDRTERTGGRALENPASRTEVPSQPEPFDGQANVVE